MGPQHGRRLRERARFVQPHAQQVDRPRLLGRPVRGGARRQPQQPEGAGRVPPNSYAATAPPSRAAESPTGSFASRSAASEKADAASA